MKSLHFTIISIFILSLFVVPSYAIISPGLSYISNDQIMSQALPSGKFDVSAKVEWWDAYEMYLGNTDFVMEPIHRVHFSYTILSVPLRLSYGITDNVSLRLSTQFIKQSRIYTDFAPYEYIGYGMGDSKVEVLYQIAGETADAPSMAINVGADILTGKSYIDLPTNASDTSFSTGMYAPNYYLSGIFGKKMGDWNGKAMIGYVVTSPDKYSIYSIDPSDQIICSLCMSTSAGNALEYGGEISAKFSGEDNRDTATTNPYTQEHSPVTRISVAPFVVFHQSSDLSWKGVLEVPLAMQGSYSYADWGVNQYRGVNISVGAELMI